MPHLNTPPTCRLPPRRPDWSKGGSSRLKGARGHIQSLLLVSVPQQTPQSHSSSPHLFLGTPSSLGTPSLTLQFCPHWGSASPGAWDPSVAGCPLPSGVEPPASHPPTHIGLLLPWSLDTHGHVRLLPSLWFLELRPPAQLPPLPPLPPPRPGPYAGARRRRAGPNFSHLLGP